MPGVPTRNEANAPSEDVGRFNRTVDRTLLARRILIFLGPVTLLLAGIAFVAAAYYTAEAQSTRRESLAPGCLGWLSIILGIGGIILLIFLPLSYLHKSRPLRCQKCRRGLYRLTKYSSKRCEAVETRARRTKTCYDQYHNETGYAEEEHDVPTIGTHHTYDFACPTCGYRAYCTTWLPLDPADPSFFPELDARHQ